MPTGCEWLEDPFVLRDKAAPKTFLSTLTPAGYNKTRIGSADDTMEH